MSDAAHVMVHGRAVGLLQRINDWEDFVFEFDPAWLADPEEVDALHAHMARVPLAS